MKTKIVIKQLMVALILTLGAASCKKDKPQEPTPINVQAITFDDLKKMSTAASVKVPDARKISGVVISDAAGKNVDGKTVILQEATGKAGIIINFDAAQTFAVGDKLEVVISNQILSQTNGEVTLTNIPAANAKKVDTETLTARTTTASDIVKNAAAWDGTLVTIGEGNYGGGSGDGKFKGMLEYTDATGKVFSNVLAGAAFENTAYPIGVKAITGIVRLSGTTVRLDIRNERDVVSKEGYFLAENFGTADVNYYMPGDKNYSTLIEATDIFGVTGFAKIKNVGAADPDKDFLTAGRNYLTLLPYTDRGSYEYDHNFLGAVLDFSFNSGGTGNYTSANNVTITFAGSNLGNTDFPAGNQLKLDAFDGTKHNYQLQIRDYSGNILFKTEVYNDLGKWHTVSFKLPAIPPDESGFFSIAIVGSIRGTILKGDNNGGYNPELQVVSTPVIIDKIVYGWDQKPEWAK